jgi:cystathionine beta-lyase/cystathionine gamma-synthase
MTLHPHTRAIHVAVPELGPSQAVSAVLLGLLRPGDHVIAQRCVYGGTPLLCRPIELAAAVISDGLIRVSVGLEHPDDLWADFEHALAAC